MKNEKRQWCLIYFVCKHIEEDCSSRGELTDVVKYAGVCRIPCVVPSAGAHTPKSKGVFTPADRLLCSETGIKIVTMLLFILGAVRFHTTMFLNGPKLLIQVTCE